MDKLAWLLIIVCVILVVLPPKWDPAIRWKERQMRKRGERKW